ncbi:MAG: hypothetical protein GC172_04045 [Phycisphaera sp.]|nr:hypothetical protein [Phycisphaera sp.]
MSAPIPSPLDPSLWLAVDHALEEWLAPADAALDHAVEAAARAGLPEIAVAPAQGRLLEVLARAVGARRVLEIGTLAGYSAIWLARALPEDGRLVTLEINAAHARVARANLDHAGLGTKVEIKFGAAVDSLDAMIAAGTEPFDLVFIDADKENCARYLEQALVLSRAGTLIVVDNIVRRGRVIDAATGDASVDGVRAMMDLVRSHPRLKAAGVQTVGAKGYDGLLIALVGEAPDARSSDPLNISLRHNAWATRELLRVCTKLDGAQWHRGFDIGPGSLHDTLTHIVGAMFRWADRIDGPSRTMHPSIEDGTRRTPAELLALLDAAAADLEAAAARARRLGLATELDVTLGGTPYRLTLGAMLVHATTHGMHHRAQCLNMLRRLGVAGVSDALPDLDVLEWESKRS